MSEMKEPVDFELARLRLECKARKIDMECLEKELHHAKMYSTTDDVLEAKAEVKRLRANVEKLRRDIYNLETHCSRLQTEVAEMSGWIGIDTLPTEDGLYLVHHPTADEEKPVVCTAWYEPDGFGWSLMPKVFISSITHWMPLPGPPK